MVSKGPNAFRTISEASEELGVPQHVLRFWETKFTFVQPMKRAGGRRFYRPQDVTVLKGVRRLLHDEGLTIKGVQKLHRDQGLKRILRAGDPDAAEATDAASAAGSDGVRPADTDRLRALLADVEAAKRRLDAALNGAGRS